MRETEPQSSITAHGNSADRSSRTSRANAVGVFDMRHKLLQEKIAVVYRAVSRVDIEAAPAFGRNDEKVAHPMLVAKIVEQSPSAAVEECLLAVSQTVQEIEHRIALRGISRRTCIVT